jgi:hypothetical protein
MVRRFYDSQCPWAKKDNAAGQTLPIESTAADRKRSFKISHQTKNLNEITGLKKSQGLISALAHFLPSQSTDPSSYRMDETQSFKAYAGFPSPTEHLTREAGV